MLTLTANDWDWGWQAGFRLKIIDGLTFGAAYLSEVRHKITDGDQEVRSLANGALLLKQGFSAEFTLPATLRLGSGVAEGPLDYRGGSPMDRMEQL